jgi:hypothetical protein
MESIHKNHTKWLIDLLKEEKPITNKWVYKTMVGTYGQMENLKTKLVAHGFEDIITPIMKSGTIQFIWPS